MGLSIVEMPVPLREEPAGTYRIGSSRVTLDVMMARFLLGDSAEDLVSAFPSLKLSDVYAVIAYYLNNREMVNAYLEEGRKKGEANRIEMEKRFPKNGLREKLLQRKQAMLANSEIK
ncbi:MAG: DUF433 domain-containing protein [Saprospiraceae bacterium]|nr:DUF433 domain-containing protein [Saprospiraceae bacterium]